MNYNDLIYTVKCCDIKDCDDCPSKGRTCCMERTMHELATALKEEESRADAAEDRAEKAENIASDLCDDFTDFVTGGIHNAAPYCENCRPECVNGRGWCNGDNKVCKGFMPKAAVWKEE